MAYSTSWKTVSQFTPGQKITDVSDSKTLQLGARVHANDFGSNSNGVGEFIYLKGVANTVAGMGVIINQDDFSTTLLAADAKGDVAVAMAAVGANQYGWYQIFGKGIVKLAGNVADNASVYAAGAGLFDDAIVAGDRVKRMRFASAQDVPAVGFAEVEMEYPFVDDAEAA